MEEAIVALAHLISIIIKLSKGKITPGIEYNGTHGYFVLFP
jgi:hypothetical protein